MFLHGKSCSSSCAAPGRQGPAVPCPLSFVLVVSSQGCLSESKGKNLMVLSQDSRMDMATISIQMLLWSQWYAHLWVAWHCHWENNTSESFFGVHSSSQSLLSYC
jgi:hypothetical protein